MLTARGKTGNPLPVPGSSEHRAPMPKSEWTPSSGHDPSERKSDATGLELPPDLAEFLRQQEPYACLLVGTDQGSAFVAKLPGREIAAVRGRVPMHVQIRLYDHPAAPVIQLVTHIYDQPQQPLALESFINIAEEDQATDFRALGEQERLHYHFYDEQLAHQLTKEILGGPLDEVEPIADAAEFLRGRIPAGRYDFDRAKAAVIRAYPL